MRIWLFIITAVILGCNRQSSFSGQEQATTDLTPSFFYGVNVDTYEGASLVDSLVIPVVGQDLSKEVIELAFPSKQQPFNDYGGRQIYIQNYIAIDSFSQMNVAPGVYLYLVLKNNKNMFILPVELAKQWSTVAKKMDLSKLAFSGTLTINDHSYVSRISNLGNVTTEHVSLAELKWVLGGVDSKFGLSEGQVTNAAAPRKTEQKAIINSHEEMALTDEASEDLPEVMNEGVASFMKASRNRPGRLAYIAQGSPTIGRWAKITPLMVAKQPAGVKYMLKQPIDKSVKIGGKTYTSEDVLANELMMLERFKHKPGFARLVEKVKIDGKIAYVVTYTGDDLETFYKKNADSPLLDSKQAQLEDKLFQKFSVNSIDIMRSLGAIYWDATADNIVATTVEGQTQFTIMNLEEIRDLADLDKFAITTGIWGTASYKAPETILSASEASDQGEREVDAWAAAQYPWAVTRAHLFYGLELSEEASSYAQKINSAPEALQMMLLPEPEERLRYYAFCGCWLKILNHGDRTVFQKYDLEKGGVGGWVDGIYLESNIKFASDLSQYEMFPESR